MEPMSTIADRTLRPDDPIAADLFNYIDDSPSPHHAVASSASRLEAAGFRERLETDAWDTVAGRWYIKRDGALIAWQRPESAPAGTRMRLAGAHTDSPNLRVKPRPDTGRAGYRQVGVEVYGGTLLNSWLDRDLGIAGRLVVADSNGTLSSVLACINEPLARVTQLAIHLDREVNDKLTLDRQLHLAPLWGHGRASDGELVAYVAERSGVSPSSVVASDLMFHDIQKASLLGADRSMYAAPRIDNLASAHAATVALAGLDADAYAVVALFDHEEVGSASATGADGAMLVHVLERIELGAGGNRESLLRSIAGSWCLSADGAHAVHPNYLDRYEPDHLVYLNQGPVVKVNVNVRYATEAHGQALFEQAAASVGVPTQSYVHRTNLACGSTIGPLTASNLGMRTIDVGSAQLSMHSARELGGADDPAYLTRAIGAFLAG